MYLQMDLFSKVKLKAENGDHVFLVIHDARIGIHP